MLGKQNKQCGLLDNSWIQHLIPEESIYEILGKSDDIVMKDEEFAEFYSANQGRYSKSPVVMTKVILLMKYEGISDREAEQKTAFDLRWKWALGLALDDEPIDHTTICKFRFLLRKHELERVIFERILEYAKLQGILKDADVQAIDSTLIHGAAAVQSTYDLLRQSISKVLGFTKRRPRIRRALLKEMKLQYETKKKPNINWDDDTAQNILLNQLLTDAQTILDGLANISDPLEPDFVEAVRVLGQVTEQDVEQTETGRMVIKQGVTRDRIVSVVDPEMRHGHKSRRRKIDGYKVTVMADVESELITGVKVHQANGADGEVVKPLLDDLEEQGRKPEKLLGDSAYGSGKQRSEREKESIELVAKAPPASHKSDKISKDRFHVYTDKDLVRCPAGRQTKTYTTTNKDGDVTKIFRFDANKCNHCILKSRCTDSDNGRTVRVGPHENLLQKARLEQRQPEFKEEYSKRSMIERIIAHVKRPGNGRGRYIGKEKTQAEMLLTAGAVNLRHISGSLATKTEQKVKDMARSMG